MSNERTKMLINELRGQVKAATANPLRAASILPKIAVDLLDILDRMNREIEHNAGRLNAHWAAIGRKGQEIVILENKVRRIEHDE